MQDSRSYPDGRDIYRLWPRKLVWLSLALTLLSAGCGVRTGAGGGDGVGEPPPLTTGTDAGNPSGGPPPTTMGNGSGSGGGSGNPGGGPTRTTAESSSARYEALAKRELQQGSIVYNPPEQMRLDERARIEARVTRRSDETFTRDLQGKGEPKVEQLPVGTRMRGELLSEDFDITPLRPQDQLLRTKGFRSWVWDIKPLRTGDLTLTLLMSVVYDGDTLEYESFDRNITVNVSPSYATSSWLSRNWDKIMSTLGVTAVGAISGILAFLRRRRTMRRVKADSNLRHLDRYPSAQ
jgi:hypothetical protein